MASKVVAGVLDEELNLPACNAAGFVQVTPEYELGVDQIDDVAGERTAEVGKQTNVDGVGGHGDAVDFDAVILGIPQPYDRSARGVFTALSEPGTPAALAFLNAERFADTETVARRVLAVSKHMAGLLRARFGLAEDRVAVVPRAASMPASARA